MAKFNVEIEWSSCLEIEAQNEEEARVIVSDFSWHELLEHMLASPGSIYERVEVYEEEE